MVHDEKKFEKSERRGVQWLYFPWALAPQYRNRRRRAWLPGSRWDRVNSSAMTVLPLLSNVKKWDDYWHVLWTMDSTGSIDVFLYVMKLEQLVLPDWTPRKNLGAYIRSLSNSSSTSVLHCLVFGAASSLDAFSSYPLGRGCPALPYQTTGKLVAPSPRSSRTEGPLPSSNNASTTKQQTCLTTV